MFGATKEELENLSREVESLHSLLPSRAQELHDQLKDIEHQIEALTSRSWPIMNRVGVEERRVLRQRVDEIALMARGTMKLIKDSDALDDELQRLERQISDLPDIPRSALQNRLRRWRNELSTFGRRISRRLDLEQEKSTLERLRRESQNSRLAVEVLRQANALLDTLGQRETAELRAALPDLSRDLLQAASAPRAMADLQALLDPLEELAESIRNPPPEFQTVSSLRRDVRGWARELGNEAAIREEHQQFFAFEWSPSEAPRLQELHRSAHELLEQLTAQAHQQRASRLQDLAKEIQIFVEACGAQPEVTKRLEELRRLAQEVERPQQHRSWMGQLDDTAHFFRAIAENYQQDLLEVLMARRTT